MTQVFLGVKCALDSSLLSAGTSKPTPESCLKLSVQAALSPTELQVFHVSSSRNFVHMPCPTHQTKPEAKTGLLWACQFAVLIHEGRRGGALPEALAVGKLAAVLLMGAAAGILV